MIVETKQFKSICHYVIKLELFWTAVNWMCIVCIMLKKTVADLNENVVEKHDNALILSSTIVTG